MFIILEPRDGEQVQNGHKHHDAAVVGAFKPWKDAALKELRVQQVIIALGTAAVLVKTNGRFPAKMLFLNTATGRFEQGFLLFVVG